MNAALFRVPTVAEIRDRMLTNLPPEFHAARNPESNIYGLVNALAISQYEILVMMQESFLLAVEGREEVVKHSKIQRKGAFWAP